MKTTLVKCFIMLTTAMVISVSANAAANDAQKEPLSIQIFVHDDVSLDLATINNDYFSWLVKNLEQITDRKVRIKFIQNEPSLTDYPYQGEDQKAIMWEWKRAVNDYIERHALPRSELRKYLLLTNSSINSATLGLADNVNKIAAISSLTSYNAPAHELGHLMNATHDAAQILYRPWPCETNMDAHRTTGFALCYIYSDENKQRITDYLNAAD